MGFASGDGYEIKGIPTKQEQVQKLVSIRIEKGWKVERGDRDDSDKNSGNTLLLRNTAIGKN